MSSYELKGVLGTLASQETTDHAGSLREAARRNRQLAYTNRILTELSDGGTPAVLAATFLAECRSFFGCGHAVAVRFESAAGAGRVLAVDSAVLRAEDLSPLTRPEAVHSAWLLLDPRPGCVDDARLLPDRTEVERLLIDRGLHSLVHVPLLRGSQLLGAVVLWAEGTGRFDEGDARQLAALSRPLSVAIERAEAVAALAESEQKYRSLVAQAEEMIFLFDTETRRILEANTYTAHALGFTPEELLELRLDDLCTEPSEMLAANVQHIMEVGEVRQSDHRYLRKDRSAVLVDVVASSMAFAGRPAVLVLARDITEVRGFQRHLMQSQKMESLGTMAGAVAHDFNNLLTTILGFAELLKRSPHLDGEDMENLSLIEEAARLAADLTGRLLAFARGGLARFGPVDLRDAVRDTMRLAAPTLQSNIRVTMDLPPEPVIVEGDQGQLQQALINIVLNARDAMPEGGTIAIELHANPAVTTLLVSDDGPGMTEETRTRIFEPFYTTKPAGSGTGLGMAITYGIVQGHHGTVAVMTTLGEGTTFVITLPLLPPNAGHRTDESFSTRDGDLILVVDDDDMVRRAAHATLAQIGYNVVEARDGATAIQLLKARPDRFAAVLLDLVMPGMTGSQTFRGLAAIRPDLPVIVCTAYAADAHIDTDVKRRIAGLIQKPFSSQRLERALAAVGARPVRPDQQA